MGRLTPDGIGVNPANNSGTPSTESSLPAVGALQNSFEFATLNLNPSDLLVNTFIQFADQANQAQENTNDLINSFITEIRETFNITDSNPDTDISNASSRLEELGRAIQNNTPQEIKSAVNSLFSGAIDSQVRLMELAGNMLGQGGGNFAGLSIGGRNLWEEAEIKARRETERSMNLVTLAMTAQQAYDAARRAAQSVIDQNREILDAVYAQHDYSQTIDQQARALRHNEGLQDVADDIVGNALEASGGNQEAALEAGTDALVDDMVENGGVSRIAAERSAEALIEDALQRADAAIINADYSLGGLVMQTREASTQQANVITGITSQALHGTVSNSSLAEMARQLTGTEFSDEEFSQDILIEAMDAAYDRSMAAIDTIRQSTVERAELVDNLRQQESIIEDMIADTIADIDILQNNEAPEAYRVRMDELEALNGQLDELNTKINNLDQLNRDQVRMIDLQSDIAQISHDYQIQVINNLPDDLSNLDLDFLKETILNAPPELMYLTAELDRLSGSSNGDPFAKMQDMAQDLIASLPTETPEDIAKVQELQQFFGELETMKVGLTQQYIDDLNELNVQKADLELALQENPELRRLLAVDLNDLEQQILGKEEVLNIILENETESLAQANTWVARELDAAQQGMAQDVDGIGFGMNGMNPALNPMMQPGSDISIHYAMNAQDNAREMVLLVSDALGVEPETELISPARQQVQEVIEEAPEPESPEVIAARLANMAEQRVWENVMDEGLTSISKEDIMNRLAEHGITGELLASSTEQLIADFQNDISVDAVTGLDYPQPLDVHTLVGHEETAPAVEQEAPALDDAAPQPASYDPTDPQYQQNGVNPTGM